MADLQVVEHRSVSQLKLYERCPYAYKLSRLDGVWQRPAAWLPQGSAVHEAVEAWERSGRTMSVEDTQDVFRESYMTHVNTYCEIAPNFDSWFKSGPYGGELDIERRFQIGLEQTAKYIDWYTDHPTEVIWIAPDGTPGIELGFDIDLDGVLVRGFIDAIIEDTSDKVLSYDGLGVHVGNPRSQPKLIVRDNKTGNHPGDDFQLAVYAVALQEMYGTFGPYWGDYWMGRSGKPTLLFDLRDWTREKVSQKFRELEDNIIAGNFEASPEPSKCRFCDVAWACEYSQ